MERERFTLKGFQRSVLIRFIAIAAGSNIIATVVFYLITKRRLDEVFYTFHLPRNIEQFILSYVITANLVSLFVVMVVLVLTMRSTFWKVAGPLFRVSQDVQKLIDGDLTVNIRLRKDDEFKDIASDFDLMGKAMKEKFSKVKKQFSELLSIATDMGIYYDDREALRKRNEMLKKNIEELKEGLNAFKI